MAGPALPWGNVPQQELPTLPNLGSTIEIKWELENTEEGTATVKWWPAHVESRDPKDSHIFTIRYAAEEDCGFDEETSRVLVMDEHTLYDDGNDEPLLWRRQGDDWDEPEGADGNPAGAAGATEQTFTMAEVSAAIDMHNRLAGVTAEQRSAEALAALPPERQRHVAAGLQDFARALEKGVEELMRRKGPGHVVNVDDVAEMKKAWERDAASRFAG